MKIFKIISIVIAITLVALLAFVVTFDANNYKPEIIEQVEKPRAEVLRLMVILIYLFSHGSV